VSVNFDTLANRTVITTQYAGVTFSSVSGQQNVALSFVGGGSSAPNILCTSSVESGLNCTQPTYLAFATPVSNVRFIGTGIDAPVGVTIATATIYAGGTVLNTRTVISAGSAAASVINFTGFSGITRLEITNITDPGGIGWDSFTYLQ